MIKTGIICSIVTLLITGCAPNNAQPLRPGIYGSVASVLVMPEKEMVNRGHLIPAVRDDLIQLKNKALNAGVNLHIICPESATPTILNEMQYLGVVYDRDIRLQNGYLLLIPKERQQR